MPQGEIRVPSEVTCLMPPPITRVAIYFGTWNARIILETGLVTKITAEVKIRNLEVLESSVTHWKHVGQQTLTSGELLVCSDLEEENPPYTQGFALALSKRGQNALVGWEYHEPRIVRPPSKQRERAVQLWCVLLLLV